MPLVQPEHVGHPPHLKYFATSCSSKLAAMFYRYQQALKWLHSIASAGDLPTEVQHALSDADDMSHGQTYVHTVSAVPRT